MNLGKALRATLNPAHWRALSNGVVPTIEHAPALRAIEPACLIDVGANKGQFSSFAAARWPRIPIFAFEPLPEPSQIYRKVLKARAKLFDCALGAEAGDMAIHVASRADSSSLRALGDEQKTIFAMEEIGTMPVKVRRLDDVLRGEIVSAPALLKIDVQGFEYEVIEGLGDLTDRISWIYVEASFVELYQGQRLFADVDQLLRNCGYELAIEHNVTRDRGRKVQADILYARRGG